MIEGISAVDAADSALVRTGIKHFPAFAKDR